MKKVLAFILVLAIAACTALPALAYDNESFYTGKSLEGTTLNVFNWGEYISDGSYDLMDVNAEFEKLTGIDIQYTTYANNEDMYAKIKSGGVSYDIIIPSDYMIERMKNEDMLQKLTIANIPNIKNISPEYRGLYFDPNDEYSVPYSVGMVGLIYNKTMVSEAPTSWSALWDEQYKGKILMIDNSRDAFAVAQSLLGFSLNTEEQAELEQVAAKLTEQKPLIQSYVMDEVFQKMEKGEAALAPYYVGDFLTMQETNPDLDFVFPEEGVNIFVDSICIPKSAENVAAAELYINFLLDPEVALANAMSICYATPNSAVLAMPEYAELAENTYLYPEVAPKTEYFHNLSVEALDSMNSLWDSVKKSGENDTMLYIGLAVVGVIIVVVLIASTVRKKKRDA